MDRRTFLAASAATTALYLAPRPLRALQQSAIDKLNEGFLKTQLVLIPVREDHKLYMASGIGGNIGVLANGDSALLIDSGSHSRTAELLDKVRGLGVRNVATLIDTHWHFDHTDGNQNLARAGAKITAHENTKKRLSTDTKMELVGITFPPAPADALPTSTFADETTIEHNGERVHLTYFPDAHTDTDIIVHFERANVLHSGDLVFNGFYPVIDYSTKGWIGGQAAGARKVAELANADTRIIPGHGPLADRQQVQAFADMLQRVHDRLLPMMQSGKTIAEVVAAKPTADLDGQWAKGRFTGDSFTELAYKSLLRHNGKQFI